MAFLLSCSPTSPCNCLQANQHQAALSLLALSMGDIIAAETYCAQNAGQEGYLALLDMLLRPGSGQAPMYAEACHLLAAKGGRGRPRALHITSAMVRHQCGLRSVTPWQLEMGEHSLMHCSYEAAAANWLV